MLRRVVAVNTLVFLLTGAYGVQAKEWVAFEEGIADGTEPEVTVISSDRSATIIDFKLYGMYREQQEEIGEVFDRLRLTGDYEYAAGCAVGGPELPFLNWGLIIPREAEVSVSFLDASAITMILPGYNVIPGDPEVYNEEVYNTDFFFPEHMFAITAMGSVRGLRIMGMGGMCILFCVKSGDVLYSGCLGNVPECVVCDFGKRVF